MGYTVYDVFTPSRPAKLTFVERESLNEKLVDALRTPGKQLVVYGHSGSGKTTLLMNKLEQIYPAHITTRCMETTTYELLLLDAFDQLAPHYEVESIKKSSTTREAKLSADYSGIKSQLMSASTEGLETKSIRVLPYQLTPAKLAELIGHMQGCWVLEDFHKVKEEEKPKLAQLMKIFMDMAPSFGLVKIVAIGAVGTAREVVQYDREMSKRVSEIYVPLMSNDELNSILLTGEDLLNVSFEPDIKAEIVKHSNGLASVCHQLALNMCQSRRLYEKSAELQMFSRDDFVASVQKYTDEESDTIKAVFEKATKRHKTRKFDNCTIILRALLGGSEDGMQHAEILKKIQRSNSGYPASNLTTYLKDLQTEARGSIVVYDQNTNKYRYSNPFYRAYAMAVFGAPQTEEKIKSHNDMIFVEITKAFKKHISIIANQSYVTIDK